METAGRRLHPLDAHFVERWGTRLPAAYFTRIVLPARFEHATITDAPLHVVGRDARGLPCYCHFACQFECPRCFPVRRARRGEQRLAIASRELRGWRLHSGRWLICTVDREPGLGPERLRYSQRPAMPASVCLDGDHSE